MLVFYYGRLKRVFKMATSRFLWMQLKQLLISNRLKLCVQDQLDHFDLKDIGCGMSQNVLEITGIFPERQDDVDF